MRCDLADPHRRPAARAWLAGALCAVLGAAGLTACSHDVSIRPPSATPDSSSARAAEAQQTLTALSRAVSDGDPSAAERLAAPGSRDLLDAIIANAQALGVTRLDLQFVDSAPGALDDAALRKYGDQAFVGAVQIDYRIPVWDTGNTHMETAFVFVPDGTRLTIAAVGGHSDRSPLWLRGPVQVVRWGRALVIDAGHRSPQAYAALGAQAVRDVNRVLPSWRGRLVVEVPDSEQELDSILNADARTYANIAAVTTTVDGSLVPGSPVHVFLNPRVFDTLKTRGSQVVLSHETTHVATNASFASMPVWLLEGFADYVALAHAHVPVQVAAAQILARIRRHGLPTHLPTEAELNPTANGLGATYEEAWLACRSLGLHFGQARLVAFYRAVDRGTKQDAAFRSVLGTSETAFVATWRRDLRRLAGGRVAG